jgi:putative transposase
MTHQFNLETYTSFLIGNGNRYSGVEASKALAEKSGVNAPAHDTISRWLANETYDASDLWNRVKEHAALDSCLIVDDSVLDKRWSPNNELVDYHWSGNEHRTIRGICLVNFLAHTADSFLPVDYRIYKESLDHKTKNDHFRDMLRSAQKRGFKPPFVLADSWYSSLGNLKLIRELEWKFVVGLKENRLVSVEKDVFLHVSALDWTKTKVHKVWLKGFGFVLVAQIVFQNGDMRYLCTNDLSLTDYRALSTQGKKRWAIEEFHRGIKQTTGIEKCYSILARSQLTHIFACFVAFVRLELNRVTTGLSWYAQKTQAVRLGIARAFA